MVNLIEIVKDWVHSLNTELACIGNRIVGPCACGKKLRVGLIKDDYVTLAKTKCECKGCAQVEINAGNPKFFEVLETHLRSRIVHKSAVVSSDVIPGDDIQHVIDHASEGTVIKLGPGIYTNESLDLKDAKMHITGLATFDNCAFNNIMKPISSDFNASFVACSFMASKEQPLQSALELPGGSIEGSYFHNSGFSWKASLSGINNVQYNIQI